MSQKTLRLFIVFLVLILLSESSLADSFYFPDRDEIIETTVHWSEIPTYYVPYYSWHDNPEETISLLSKLSKESLKNCTDPESQIYDPYVLKAYGNVPEIKNTSQMAEFSSSLKTVRDSSIFEVKPYLYPDGPIVDYGSGSMPGYFLIKLYDYEGNKIVYSEKELKEIYRVVEKHAIKAGIHKVPVMFCLWDKTAMFYFPGNNSTFGRDVVQLTDVEFPVLYYYPANSSSLQAIKNSSLDEIEPYLYPEGSIIAYGSDTMDQFFPIELFYEGNETVYSQSELNEIYDIVMKHANKVGLDGVSVVFYNEKNTVRFDTYYNESYFRSGNSAPGTVGGIENSTSNISGQLSGRKITTFPIDNIYHVAVIGLCATLLIIFGVITVKN